MPQKEIRYLNKDFDSFKSNLIEFAKQYYPNTYNDFNESSPGMMFIEMASYVGDVLSYYVDSQFKEQLLAYSTDQQNLYEMAQSFGYKPKLATASQGVVDIFQIVPAKGSGENNVPNYSYALQVNEGSTLESTTGVTFRLRENVNFSYSSSFDPTTVTTYEVDSGNEVTYYLLKKSLRVVSGNISEEQIVFGAAQKYPRGLLGQTNVLEIISCTDSDGNNWKEVPFLAQDTVFDSVRNTEANDPELSQYSDEAPYILKLLKTPRRFVTFIRGDGKTELRFGSGISDNPDEEIIPNPTNVGSSLPGSPTYLDQYFDPSNFLNTKAYGQAPANTTLTIKYSYGGGITDNVPSDTITSLSNFQYTINTNGLSSGVLDTVVESLGVTNPQPTTGAKGAESTKELKENALAFFQSQGRAVTKEDYITRVYSLPPKFGAVAKAYIVQDEQLNLPAFQKEVSTNIFVDQRFNDVKAQDVGSSNRLPNPNALNLYCLGYNGSGQLTQLSIATKENIKTHLSQYRLVTDAVNIKNAFIINIGVKFNFIARAGFNKEEVTLRCIERVKQFFNVARWQINQPIIIQELAYELSIVDGVGAIVPPTQDNPKNLQVLITNKFSSSDGYSGNIYDINYATKDGIVYPSLDPSIFELKYPNTDIEGRAIGDSTGNQL